MTCEVVGVRDESVRLLCRDACCNLRTTDDWVWLLLTRSEESSLTSPLVGPRKRSVICEALFFGGNLCSWIQVERVRLLDPPYNN